MEQFAQFTVSGQRVYGMLHVPDGEAPGGGWPCVVMLHGFTGNRIEPHRLFPLLSRFLSARGVASLRFDFRGSGESEGDFSEMTVTREVEDVEAAFGYVRGLPMLDHERVMLLGFSMGGLVAALAAGRVRPHRLALWAPALPELWLPFLKGGHVPPVTVDYGGWPLGREFLLEMPRLRPLEAASRWGGVARVFHGDVDDVVSPAMGVRYAQALGCDAVGIPGANHTFDSLEAVETLYAETARFLLGG